VVVFQDKFADFPDESPNLQLIPRDAEQAGMQLYLFPVTFRSCKMIPPEEVQTSFVATVNQTSYTADEEQAQKAVVVFPNNLVIFHSSFLSCSRFHQMQSRRAVPGWLPLQCRSPSSSSSSTAVSECTCDLPNQFSELHPLAEQSNNVVIVVIFCFK